VTTICYKDNEIAFDSRCTAGDRIVDNNYNKKRSIEGYHFFCAGSTLDIEKLIAAVFDQEFDLHPKREGNLQAVAFLVSPDSQDYKCGYVDDELILMPLDGRSCDAIGSGEEYAIGAMDAGLSAKDAVKIACNRDIYSGGRIRTFRIQE
jgi:ATP-dependent protease HslVU (ClpYQ) peptidase subunit